MVYNWVPDRNYRNKMAIDTFQKYFTKLYIEFKKRLLRGGAKENQSLKKFKLLFVRLLR
jgi:hypothetical protein